MCRELKANTKLNSEIQGAFGDFSRRREKLLAAAQGHNNKHGPCSGEIKTKTSNHQLAKLPNKQHQQYTRDSSVLPVRLYLFIALICIAIPSIGQDDQNQNNASSQSQTTFIEHKAKEINTLKDQIKN